MVVIAALLVFELKFPYFLDIDGDAAHFLDLKDVYSCDLEDENIIILPSISSPSINSNGAA